MDVKIRTQNKEIIDLLCGLSVSERKIIIETAMLYYARYLEDNPQIIDPVLDITKLPCNEGKDFTRNLKLDRCEEICEDKDVSYNIFRYAMELKNKRSVEQSDEDKKTILVIRFKTCQPKVEEMLRQASPRVYDLIETSLLCYMHILATDPNIIDFRLMIKPR